jgi:hypothetical protein
MREAQATYATNDCQWKERDIPRCAWKTGRGGSIGWAGKQVLFFEPLNG